MTTRDPVQYVDITPHAHDQAPRPGFALVAFLLGVVVLASLVWPG